MTTQQAQPVPYEYEPSRLSPERVIPVPGATPRVRFRLDKPCIAVIDNLLTLEECRLLRELGEPRLEPSLVRIGATLITVDLSERSSYTHQFKRGEHEILADLDKRFCQLMGLPDEHGEGLSVSRYEEGQFVKAHRDYFVPAHPIAEGGARIATLLMYLNDDYSGGETRFDKVGLTVEPKAGTAVYFEYGNSKGQRDKMSSHAGLAPTSGTKWIAIKLMRAHPFPS